jgi:hypothetical protein
VLSFGGGSSSSAAIPGVAAARGGTWPWSGCVPSGARAAPVVMVGGHGSCVGNI